MMGRRASRSPIFNVFIVKVALNLYFSFLSVRRARRSCRIVCRFGFFVRFSLSGCFDRFQVFRKAALCGESGAFVSFGSRVSVKILYVGSGQFVFLLLFRCRCDGQFELLEPCHGCDVQGCDIAVHVAVVSCQGDHRRVVGRELEFGQEGAPSPFSFPPP